MKITGLFTGKVPPGLRSLGWRSALPAPTASTDFSAPVEMTHAPPTGIIHPFLPDWSGRKGWMIPVGGACVISTGAEKSVEAVGAGRADRQPKLRSPGGTFPVNSPVIFIAGDCAAIA